MYAGANSGINGVLQIIYYWSSILEIDFFIKQDNEKNMVPCYIVGIRKVPQRSLHHQTEEEGYHIFLTWFDPHLHILQYMVPTHPNRWNLHQLYQW